MLQERCPRLARIISPGGETRPYSSPKTMDKDNKERIHLCRHELCEYMVINGVTIIKEEFEESCWFLGVGRAYT